MSYGHLCGCYYFVPSSDYYVSVQKQYLPLLESEVHSTIYSNTSRTILKQTFTNPSPSNLIKECIYTFPLYDGVSVVSFTCRIGKKVLRGLVKEKIKAKEIFDQAVAKGETAGLLEQAPESADVFSTKLGNIPAGTSVIVEIEYVGELKHQDTDGIRFTIPTMIAPRYGSGPTFSISTNPTINAQDKDGMKITVDINMPEGIFIKGVQSPSHPIAVSMGTVSTATSVDPTMSKASATLSQGSSALDKDFVLIVQSRDVGTPKAILETHPDFPNQRAIMATLVPKFALPPSRPEIVFVADRSGSMAGNIPMLISAMKVFLKSVPSGVKFNICSFGSRHHFLWPKSMTYTKETVDQAMSYVSSFQADMGGTETFEAIKATIERRHADIPLEIMLLTDGDISRQNELFTYLNEQVEKTKGNIRVFPLGIGIGVSHSLIEGVARAGNGFAQAVQDGERLDTAVVKMLRGALTPHITDYTLEVKYEQDDDDFELIDKVTDGMKVLLSDENQKSEDLATKPTISLFDTTINLEKDDMKEIANDDSWLPKITSPKVLQAPYKIPSLFAFSRTSVYLLMSPETIQRNPVAVILRAISEHGPLALEIPVEKLSVPAQTIHQLAAKKAVQDLEEGRGWIFDAKDSVGVSVKAKYSSCFDDLVKREAVRLGERFQIAGKWCSFVAVAANDKKIKDKATAQNNGDDSDEEFVDGDFDMVPKATENAPPSYYSHSGRTSTFPKKSRATHQSGRDCQQDPGSCASWDDSPDAGVDDVNWNDHDAGFRNLHRMRRGPVDTEANPISVHATQAASIDATSIDSLPTATRSARSRSSFSPMQVFNRVGGLSRSTIPNIVPSSSATRSTGSSPWEASHQQMHQSQVSSSWFANAAPQSMDSARTQQQPLTSPPIGTSTGSGLFGLQSQAAGPPVPSNYVPPSGRRASGASFNQAATNSTVYGGLASFGAPPPPVSSQRGNGLARSIGGSTSLLAQRKGNLANKSKYQYEAEAGPEVESAHLTDWSNKSTIDKVLALIALQDFEGSWTATTACGRVMSAENMQTPDSIDGTIWITLLVVKFLEIKCMDEEGTWGLVVEKAKDWLESLGVTDLEDWEQKAGEFIS